MDLSVVDLQEVKSKIRGVRPLRGDGRYTTAYIDALPEDVRVELIRGRLYDMAAPTANCAVFHGIPSAAATKFPYIMPSANQ